MLGASVAGQVSPLDSEAQLREAVTGRDVDFGLLWDGQQLQFFFDAARLQENYAFEQMAEGISAEFNRRRQGTPPVLHVVRHEAGRVQSMSWLNLVLPGILAFSILSSGLFAVSGHLTQMKERQILDRMIVTPMRPVALLASIALVRLVVGFLSTLLTLGIGILVFRLEFAVDWMRYVVFVLCATLGTMGLGTMIALVVRRPSSAGNVANVLAMVMMFMAGVYFPIEFMPQSLRTISQALPLTHMAQAMRYVTGVIDMSEARFWGTSAAFLVAAIVLFPLMARYVVRPSRS
ncbi:MAG TPA: ABC transporter permease [Candidatus Acetothermia bacterium]|nr:ABC transporter permease [Candidatus Acetothermia bacterium]